MSRDMMSHGGPAIAQMRHVWTGSYGVRLQRRSTFGHADLIMPFDHVCRIWRAPTLLGCPYQRPETLTGPRAALFRSAGTLAGWIAGFQPARITPSSRPPRWRRSSRQGCRHSSFSAETERVINAGHGYHPSIDRPLAPMGSVLEQVVSVQRASRSLQRSTRLIKIIDLLLACASA